MSSCKTLKKEIYILGILWICFLVISSFMTFSDLVLVIVNSLVCVYGFYILFKCSKKNTDSIKKTGHENFKKMMDDIGIP